VIKKQISQNAKVISFKRLVGKLTFNSKTILISASLELQKGGELVLRGSFPFGLSIPDKSNLEFTNKDGWVVTCEDCYVTFKQGGTGSRVSFASSPGRVTARLGTVNSDAVSFAVFVGGDKEFCGENINFIGHQSYLKGQKILGLKEEIGHVCINAKGMKRDTKIAILRRIQVLLNLAYCRLIAVPWICTYDDQGNISIEMTRVYDTGRGQGFMYVEYPRQITNLLKNSWSRWNSLNGKMQMVQLIQHYVAMKDQIFVDCKIMLQAIWLEAFKHQYAKNVKKYPTDKQGYFLNPNKKNKHGKPVRFSFEELVLEGMQYFGIKKPYNGFKTARNEIIHAGIISSLNNRQKQEVCDDLDEMIRTFFLKSLRYSGLVWGGPSDKWIPFK
jgi:hypothetical protein